MQREIWDHRDLLVLGAIKVNKANPARKGLKDLWGEKDPEVLLDPVDKKEKLVNQDRLVCHLNLNISVSFLLNIFSIIFL